MKWPAGIGGKGNEGVAAYVKQIKGGIGYVELSYALQNKMAYAAMQNAAGKWVLPSDESFAAAAASADWANSKDFYLVITNAPGEASWPITATNFIIMYKQPKNAGAAKSAKEFFRWVYANGDEQAKRLDYVPLPAALVDADRGVLDRQLQVLIADRIGTRTSGARARFGVRYAGPVNGAHEHERIPPIHRATARYADRRGFRWLVGAPGIFVLLALVGAALSMLWGGRLAFETFGWSFLTTEEWDVPASKFGALVPIYGTLVTAGIAMIIAVPVSFGIAMFLTEVAPPWLRGPVGRRDRVARRHPVDHLRHVGPVRAGALPQRARLSLDRRATSAPCP